MVAIKCRYVFEYSEEAPDMPDDELSEYVEEVINRARMLAGETTSGIGYVCA